MTALQVVSYTDLHRGAWDEFVGRSRNGTFLFERNYMDYHRDRFTDCSRMIEENGRVVALFPASKKGDAVSSHGGLTYGGLIADDNWKVSLALRSLHALCVALAEDGARSIRYKTVPWHYHRGPAEEDRYALTVAGAVLARRDVVTVVDARNPLPFQERRRRGARKAGRAGLVARASDDLVAYWQLLSEHLEARFGRSPVHTLEEIQGLKRSFPSRIKLYGAYEGTALHAGVLVYETETTARAQYIASTERGRELGALDLLFEYLLGQEFRAKPYFDFGTSMEEDGRSVRLGLLDQKEGFGGRTVVHDHYDLAPDQGAVALARSGMLEARS